MNRSYGSYLGLVAPNGIWERKSHKMLIISMSGLFQIGVYGPRAVCNVLESKGLTRYSFVADMSSGFTGNIGQPMQNNWAYEQICEITTAGIGIDKCVVSP